MNRLTPQNDPTKVAFPFIGDRIGGSHISTLSLIDGLKDDPLFEPHIYLFQEGLLAQYLKQRKIPYTVIDVVSPLSPRGVIPDLIKCIRDTATLASFLKKRHIGIIHTNDMRNHLHWAFAAKIAGCKHIVHARTFLKSRRDALFFRIAEKVLAISQSVEINLSSFGVRQSKVIFNPVAVDRLEPSSQLLSYADKKIIGFVGNLAPQKRVDFFVEIADALTKTRNDLLFVIVGEKRPPYAEEIAKLIADKGLQDKIILLGEYFPISQVISEFDVLLAPATKEAFGRVLVESMHCGVPVVASKDGGHEEIIQDGRNGFLCDPNDSNAFVGAVLNLLNNQDLRNSIIHSARLDAGKNYSVASHVGKVKEIYSQVFTKVNPA